MHRSNNICPISAIWTVVCCVFDSAGFLFLITIAIQLFKYPSPIKARVSERNKNILHCNYKNHTFLLLNPIEGSVAKRVLEFNSEPMHLFFEFVSYGKAIIVGY